MIRQATKYDKKDITEMMVQFCQESEIEQYRHIGDSEHWQSLLDSILAGRGVVFIKPSVGVIVGLISPVIWCNKTLAMYELAWYVKPEHRKGTTGYRLLQAYIEYGKKLKEEGRIKLFTLSKLANSPDMNYAKLGFVKTDENWMQ